jgi:integrase
VQIAENATALSGPVMGLLVITAGWTGLRWGEITGLQRRNLHLDDGVLLVDRYVGGLHESSGRMWLGPPKTNASVRIVTLPPFLIALLQEHLDQTDGVAVFSGPRGGWLRRSNVDRRILRPAADGNQDLPRPRVPLLPVRPGLTFHGLRHSQKTWLIADGVPEIAQAKRLGHHLHDRVVETYSHVAPEVERRLLDGLEARWYAAQAYLHPHTTATTAPAA